MMEFLAANFNLPTIIVAVIVFGGVGWITWHSHKHGGGCSCLLYTSLMGEKYVEQFCHRHFIVRTAWLYSYYGKNFVKTIVNAGKKRCV